jgi:hypothetical protein
MACAGVLVRHSLVKEAFSFPLEFAIAIAAFAFNLLMSVVYRRNLAFWMWGLYSRRWQDRIGTLLCVGLNALLNGVLTTLVVLFHELAGVRASDGWGVALLAAEAVIAGWVALRLVEHAHHADRSRGESPPGESRAGDLSELAGLAILVIRTLVGALDDRARTCVAPILVREMNHGETRRQEILTGLVAYAPPNDKEVAALVRDQNFQAWNGASEGERWRGVETLSSYVIRNRTPPHALLGTGR